MSDLKAETAGLTFRQPDKDSFLLILSGVWKIGYELPSADEVRKGLESTPAVRMAFDARNLADWDSALLTFLLKIREYAAQKQIK